MPQTEPTLKAALAVAALLRRRCASAVADVQNKCERLERELAQLQKDAQASHAPPPPQPPLLQVLEAAAAASSATAAAAPTTTASATSPDEQAQQEALQLQLTSLELWHRAEALLPPNLQPVLGAAQRYLLLRELQQPGVCLPAAGMMARTPITAFLELASDILQTSSRREAAAAAAAAAGLPAPEPPLSQGHTQLLASACAAIVHLFNWPGAMVLESDFAALQPFCELVLQMAVNPPLLPPEPPQQPGPAAAGSASPPCQQAAAGAAPPQPQRRQPPACAAVESQVLVALRQSAPAGMLLLGSTATAAANCMEDLVARVTGEPLAVAATTQPDDGCSGAGAGAGAGGSQAAAEAAAAEETRLLHILLQLGDQLLAALRLLPEWYQALGGWGDALIQDVAGAIESAQGDSHLINVTHPAAARQMQRVAVQLRGALHQMAAASAAEPQGAA